MNTHRIGIIMNGVTGRMGTNQHLIRSIVAIIKQGGVRIGADEVIMPDPILVGRNENKLRELCARTSASPAGRPISTRPSPIPTTASISTPNDRPPRRWRAKGGRRRKTHLLRETHRRGLEDRAGTPPALPKGRRQERRRAGQALARRHS